MAQIQNLVLTDRAATPVAHTFKPAGFRDNGIVAVLTEQVGGIPAAEREWSQSHRRQGGKMKTRVVFKVPVVQTETINGISKPKVVREGTVDATFTFSLDSTVQERDDVVGMFMSGLDPAKIVVDDTLVEANYTY